MTYVNGGRYDGDFVRGKKEGYGNFVWVDGKEYDGLWKNDQPYRRGLWNLLHGYGL